MSNEVQQPDSTPDTRPESVPSAAAGDRPDKETKERNPQTLYELVMWLAQWAKDLTTAQLIKVCILIAAIAIAWWLTHGGR